METLYFIDGYHGGIRGHMPEGSWQDILHALQRWRSWKISLEIEPESWEYLRRHDVYTYSRLQDFVGAADSANRVEFIGGSYAQPFCWAVNGESNIRQLLCGIALTKKHFTKIEIDTYAVQEPCFTSALPQILTKMGFRRMSLKNPTAWGGYMEKMSGEIVHLKSADGSRIPAVPRYLCEELIGCSATEASGYDYSSISAFAEKCAANGITAPAGMCLQDLGWSSAPLVQDMDVEYVTWREYFQRFGDKCSGEVPFRQEDILVALPWGNRILQEMLRNVRRQENRILQTEKLLAIAETEDGAVKPLQKCREMLTQAWKKLMQAQHHDGFICATCGEGVEQWGFQSNALAADCGALLEDINTMSMEAVTGRAAVSVSPEKEIWLRVYNTVGNPRTSQAQMYIGLEPGIHSLKICTPQGEEVPCQYTAVRRYADGGIGCALVRFPASVQGVGYRVYKLLPCREKAAEPPGIARKGIQDSIEVKTDLLHLVFDLKKGGALVRFLDRTTGRDYAGSAEGFGCLQGYFVRENRFVDTGNARSQCEIIENGPLCCRLKFSGKCGEMTFHHLVAVYSASPKIDFETTVNFERETEIGYPYAPKPEEAYHGTRRSSLREDYKLGVQLPLGSAPVRVMKSAPFDVYESKLADTRYADWRDIRHNIINGYMDIYQESTDTGIAVFCDSVNGYALAENRLSLTVAFGYHGNFWWGHQPAKGSYRLGYSLMPHGGNAQVAAVAFADAKLREPLLVQRLPEKPKKLCRTLFCCESRQVETVAMPAAGPRYHVRLFHSGSDAEKLKYTQNLPGFQGEAVDLRGIPLQEPGDSIGGFEIKTLQ